MRVSYDGLVDYSDAPGISVGVTVAFSTDRFGTLQVGRNRKKLIEYGAEPNLYNFTDEEREYIEQIAAIVFRLTHDCPKHESFK